MGTCTSPSSLLTCIGEVCIDDRCESSKVIRLIKEGSYEKRVDDPEVRYWTNWAGIKPYKPFNGYPQLTDIDLNFAFYAIGKVIVPLL